MSRRPPGPVLAEAEDHGTRAPDLPPLHDPGGDLNKSAAALRLGGQPNRNRNFSERLARRYCHSGAQWRR